jgi:glycosyltransferase involved in cell wall biosynthesis
MNDPYPVSLIPFPSPMTFSYRVFRDPLRKRLVKQALQRSTLVVFPNERLCSYMEQSLELNLGSKCLILPHVGWSGNASVSSPVDRSRFEILHCGRLSSGRASDVLLKSLQNVVRRNPGLGASIRLTLLGYPLERETLGKIEAMKLEEIIRMEDPVSYEESLVRMKGASALLLAEDMMSQGIFLPSKFVDYLCSGRPLLMFSPERGTISDMVHGYDHPGFLGQTEAIATERLMNFMLARQRGDDLSRYCYGDVTGFSPSTIADKFLDAASKVAITKVKHKMPR